MVEDLHFDCFAGAAGDMLLGALINLGVPLTDIKAGLATISGLSGYTLRTRRVRRMSLAGTHLTVTVRGRQPQSR